MDQHPGGAKTQDEPTCLMMQPRLTTAIPHSSDVKTKYRRTLVNFFFFSFFHLIQSKMLGLEILWLRNDEIA